MGRLGLLRGGGSSGGEYDVGWDITRSGGSQKGSPPHRRDEVGSQGPPRPAPAGGGGQEEAWLEGLEIPVYVASYWLKKRDGQRERRFVLSTKAMHPRHIVRWGKRGWRIEGFFKTAKGRFSLGRFGQGTKLGVYRYLLLSLMAYLLAHRGHLLQGAEGLPRWAEAARAILEEVLAERVIEGLLMEIEERGALLRRHGIEVRVDRCKI